MAVAERRRTWPPAATPRSSRSWGLARRVPGATSPASDPTVETARAAVVEDPGGDQADRVAVGRGHVGHVESSARPDSTAGRAGPPVSVPAESGCTGCRRWARRRGRPGGWPPGAPPTRPRARRSGRAGRCDGPATPCPAVSGATTPSAAPWESSTARVIPRWDTASRSISSHTVPTESKPRSWPRWTASSPAIIQSGQAWPGGTSFWPSRKIRPSMLVVVPGRSWASAAGRTTSAWSRTAPGAVATATTKSAAVERPLGQPAVGEVGQRIGTQQHQRGHRRSLGLVAGRGGQDVGRAPAPALGHRAPGAPRTRPARPRGRPGRAGRRGRGPCRGHRGRCRGAGPAGTGPRAGRRPASGRRRPPARRPRPATAGRRPRPPGPRRCSRRARSSAAASRGRGRRGAAGHQGVDQGGGIARPVAEGDLGVGR